MSVIQLSAGSESNGKERQPLVAVTAGSRQVTVSLIIPTLNEAKNLTHVLPALPDVVDELVSVDSGSTDGTLDVIRQLRPDAKIISEPRRGKGIALQAGFAAAGRRHPGDHGRRRFDGPQDIPTFWDAAIAGSPPRCPGCTT